MASADLRGTAASKSLIKLFAEAFGETGTVLSISLDRLSFDEGYTGLIGENEDLKDAVFAIPNGINYKYCSSDPDSEEKIFEELKSFAARGVRFDFVFLDIGVLPDGIFEVIQPNGMLVVRRPSLQFDKESLDRGLEQGRLPNLAKVTEAGPLEYIYDKISKTSFHLNGLVKFPDDDPLSPRKVRVAKNDDSTGKTVIKQRSFSFDKNEFCLISNADTPLTLFSPSSISEVFLVCEAVTTLTKGEELAGYPVIENFVNFRIHEAERQLASLNSEFKNFAMKPLSSVVEDICIPSTKWRRNNADRSSTKALYIPSEILDEDLEPLFVIGDEPFEHILGNDEFAGARVLRLECMSELEARYLGIFFKSNFGRLILSASLGVNSSTKIDGKRLISSTIPIPDDSTKERIAIAHQSLSTLRTQISSLQNELFINPLDPETNEKIAEMLSAGNNLTAEDRFRHLVQRGESKSTEFKTTFQMCLRTGEIKPEVETSALKSIVGFMNADGGALLLGVTDDQSIVGLEEELRKFHGKKGNPLDSFILRLKDKIKRRIGKASLSLVTITPLKINGKDVFQVDCSMASEGVYLDDEHFYLRVPAATEQMKGPQLEKYLRRRFG